MKPTWEHAGVELYLGDCLDVMLSIRGAQTVVFSPPYNKTGFREGKLGHSHKAPADMNYNTFDDNMLESEYWAWQRAVLGHCSAMIQHGGSVFYNHKVRRYNGIAHHPMQELNHLTLNFYQQIVWNRRSSVDNNLYYMTPTTELILWFAKEVPQVFKSECPHKSEVWNMAPACDPDHPATFPIALPRACILLTTSPGNLVVDPFMGSGTTGVAAVKEGRRFVGIELDPEYFEIAKKRIMDAQKQPRLFA